MPSQKWIVFGVLGMIGVGILACASGIVLGRALPTNVPATPIVILITVIPEPAALRPVLPEVPAQRGTPSPTVASFAPAPLPKPTASASDAGGETIAWSEAQNYVGQTKTVCGTVARANYAAQTTGKPTYLDLGRAYPDPARVSVLIWGESREKFSTPPEIAYKDKPICVTGVIKLYRGLVEIEVKAATQIQIK